MKCPTRFSELGLSPAEVSQGPYPPRGFLPVWDAALGNGDYFGLYWPLGREARDPIVCEMHHDAWILVPEFASAHSFAEWLADNEGERGELPVEESAFAPCLYRKACQAIEAHDAASAIDLLMSACEALPEVPRYWSALSSQLRRMGRKNESYHAARRAFLAGWHFGRPDDSVLRTLRAALADGVLAHDPIISRSEAMTHRFGGEKDNVNYGLLREAIDEYFAQGAYLDALSLHQNYAYMMMSETTSFQERHGFRVDEWRTEFAAACRIHLGDDRSSFSDEDDGLP